MKKHKIKDPVFFCPHCHGMIKLEFADVVCTELFDIIPIIPEMKGFVEDDSVIQRRKRKR